MAYEIDELDKKILRILRLDSRRPFLEIARELKVSGGTIHVRVGKLKDAGIIKGSKLLIDYGALGYTINTFIGLKLTKASLAKEVQEKLLAIDEITEIHYTTGSYHLFIRLRAKNMRDLYQVLSDKVQNLDAVMSTESFIILDTSVDRELIL